MMTAEQARARARSIPTNQMIEQLGLNSGSDGDQFMRWKIGGINGEINARVVAYFTELDAAK